MRAIALKRFVAISVFCMGLGATGLAAATSQVVIAEANDITTFDPHMATDKPTISVNEHIFEGLLARDDHGEFVPVLATAWEVDDSKLVWTFRLREGVRFSDGTAFDANAVKANIDRIMDRTVGAAGRARLAGLDRVEVVDAATIRFVTKYPWPALLDGLAGNSTRIVSPAALAKLEGKIDRSPVGTGPYTLEKWEVGREASLVRNEHYWGKPPLPERIVYKPVTEASVRVSLLQAGQADIAMKLSPELVPRLRADARFSVATKPSSYSVFYMLNMKRPPLDDRRVREAINIAIDREAIIEGILEGFGTVPRSIFAPSVMFRSELAPIQYNPERARKLLKEAGHPNLSLTLWTSPRYQNDKQIAEAIQAYLAQVGIKLDIKLYDWGTYWGMINNQNKEVDLYLLATTIEDPAYRLEWNFGQYAGRYWGGYGNEGFWKMLEDASRTIDREERKKAFVALQEKIWHDMPYLFLYDRTLINATRKDLTGFKVDAREIWNLREVTVPGAEAKR